MEISATAANSKYTDAVLIHIRESHEIVRDLVEVLDSKNGIFDAARFAAAVALKTRIECNDNKAFLRERFAVHVARRLFLATSNWVGADNCRILLLLIEVRRKVDIGRNVPISVIDFHVLEIFRCHAITLLSSITIGEATSIPASRRIARSVSLAKLPAWCGRVIFFPV